MGSSHSYVTDPNVFATEVKETEDRSHWKSYDYVVVGGGAFRDGSREPEPLTNETPSRHGWLGACIAPLGGPEPVGPFD